MIKPVCSSPVPPIGPPFSGVDKVTSTGILSVYGALLEPVLLSHSLKLHHETLKMDSWIILNMNLTQAMEVGIRVSTYVAELTIHGCMQVAMLRECDARAGWTSNS